MNGVIPRTVRPDGTRRHVGRHARPRESRTTTTRCGARCAELGVAPAFHGVGYGWGSRVPADQLRLQPPRQLRRRQEAVVPLAGVGRRAPALPRPALRVPGGRRGVGGAALRRSPRALREAQHRRHPALRPGAASIATLCGRLSRRVRRPARIRRAPRPLRARPLADARRAAARARDDIDEFAESLITDAPTTRRHVHAASSTSAARPTTP